MHAVIMIVVVLIVGAASVLGYAMYLATGLNPNAPIRSVIATQGEIDVDQLPTLREYPRWPV
jgi:hypothetical protein